MRTLEIGGLGSGLVGAGMAGLVPAHACSHSEKEARFAAGAGVATSVGPPSPLPWADLVVMLADRPNTWEADLVRRLDPRFVVAEIRGNDSLLGPIMALGYEGSIENYAGIEFGLPQSCRKRFAVLWRRGLRPTARFCFPDGRGGNPVLGQFLDNEPEQRLWDVSGILAYWKRKEAMAAASGRGHRLRILGPGDVMIRFPARYCGEYPVLVDEGRGPRRFSSKEALRIMGMPGGYPLPVPETMALGMIGRCAWPPAVAALAREVIEWATSPPPSSSSSLPAAR